jgi:hypothetical protein
VLLPPDGQPSIFTSAPLAPVAWASIGNANISGSGMGSRDSATLSTAS